MNDALNSPIISTDRSACTGAVQNYATTRVCLFELFFFSSVNVVMSGADCVNDFRLFVVLAQRLISTAVAWVGRKYNWIESPGNWIEQCQYVVCFNNHSDRHIGHENNNKFCWFSPNVSLLSPFCGYAIIEF